MKKIKFVSLMIIFTILFGCRPAVSKQENKPASQEKAEKEISLNIITTNKLLYHIVKDIVKDRHLVDYMFASKERLLNFEYSEDSINNISKKDIFFYWDSGVEPWIGDFVDKLSKNKVVPINISRGIKIIDFERETKENPYFWMNIDYYKIAMLNVKNAIQDKDTKSREEYEKNFSAAIKEIEVYQKKYDEVEEKLKEYTFIVDGDELDYFIKYHGLKTLKIYNYGVVLSTEDIEKNYSIESKLQENENIVFLYSEDAQLKANETIISKYQLKTAHITVYKEDMNYIDMLNSNLVNLKKVISE